MVSNEDARKTARAIAMVFLVVGLAIAYVVWPTGIMDLPLRQMTLDALSRALASVAIALGALVMTATHWF